MTKLPSQHLILDIRGSAYFCGKAYGEAQAEAIAGFLNHQLSPAVQWRRYAKNCWDRLRSWNDVIVELIQGIADGTGRPVEEIVLALLHEEIGHAKACTAFGATGSATAEGMAIIGQNWDWNPMLYLWPHLLRLTTDAMPATLTYAFPGLWAAAGMNENGLSLVWTSSGMFPWVRPIVGIPTYALIAGILTCDTVDEAIGLLRRTCNAGCFLFFLADAGGQVCVVEGVPGQTFVVPCTDVISRANYYDTPQACKLAAQQVPRGSYKNNNRCRARRMADLLRLHAGGIDPATAEIILCDHEGGRGKTICQHEHHGITLDSFYLLPARRELRIARGIPCRHDYQQYFVR